MSSLLPLLLHWLHEYSYPVLWLAVFIAAVGLPLPTSLFLLAAGTFARLGDFNIVLLIGITITASTCGDNVGYFIGRRWGKRTLRWLGQPRRLHIISARTITRARLYFERREGLAILFSRFLFPALGGVINLLAGADRYSYRRFLLYDAGGETLNAVVLLSLGYAFRVLGGRRHLVHCYFDICFGAVLSRALNKDDPTLKESIRSRFAYGPQKLSMDTTRPKGEKISADKGKKPPTLEGQIEEYKAHLRYFQCLIGPERLELLGGVATIERQLIMIDALSATAQVELQQNYDAHKLADFLYAVFTTVRDNRTTTDPRVLAVEAEYQHLGGVGLNRRHNVVLFTTGSFYEHMSGKELSADRI